MATSCLTVFEADGAEIAVLYREMDGQPTGHGQYLKYILCNPEADYFENCRLCPPKTRNLGEQYIYTVSIEDGRINLVVQGLSILYPELTSDSVMTIIYEGDIREFVPYLAASNWRDQ